MITTSYNSNLNREWKKGELLPESQGLMPPFMKKHTTEQYYGREISNCFWWDHEEETCQKFNLRTSSLEEVENARELYNSPSALYYNWAEIWQAQKLIAILCGEEYLSPEEHLNKYRGDLWRPRRNTPNCQDDIGKYCNRENDIEKIVADYAEELAFPASYSRKFLEDEYPGIKERPVKILRFDR